MPVVQWVVRVGYRVETRDGEIGTVREIFSGPARSMFLASEPYMIVADRAQPDLYVPFEEIADIGEMKGAVYLKRRSDEIEALRWTVDPRRPSMAPIHYNPQPRGYEERPDARGTVGPRPRGETGAWQPGEAAPRREPGRGIRIGDRFKPGDAIPAEGQYMCTVCWERKHSRQFREENADGRFPPAHHPGALWELEDLRP